MTNIIRALCANFLRALCVLFLFAFLTACAANRGGEQAEAAPVILGTAGAMFVALHQRRDNNDPPPATPTMTVATGPIIDPSLYGAYRMRDVEAREYFVVFRVDAEGEERTLFGETQRFEREMVTQRPFRIQELLGGFSTPDINRASLHASGDIVPLVDNEGDNVILHAIHLDGGNHLNLSVALEGFPGVTMVPQLCALVPWAALTINSIYRAHIDVARTTVDLTCPRPSESEMSYSPDIGRVVAAAMDNGFRRGVVVGESAFSFSGYYDDNDRAAGFTYDFADNGFALRTDYVRLPSKQDGEVWLDTYRFGVLRRINDETRLFAGVDSYDNAIFALDMEADGNLWHRFGAAMAKTNKEYALHYELRLNL